MRLIASLLVLASFSSVSFAEDKLTAKDLITKAIDAVGGEKTIKKYPGTIQKSKGTIQIMGMEVAFTSEELNLDPDKQKSVVTLDVGGQKVEIVQIVNGEKASMVVAGNETPLPDEAKAQMVEGIILNRAMSLVGLLEDKDFEVKLLDSKADVDGKETRILSIKHKKMNEAKFYFDSKTFLLVKVEKEGTNAEMQVGKQEWFLSDYKKSKEGINSPQKVKVLHEGKAFLETELTEIKQVESIDKSEFDLSK